MCEFSLIIVSEIRKLYSVVARFVPSETKNAAPPFLINYFCFFHCLLDRGHITCSGFVTWCFINSGFNASSIGHGTKGQIAKCSRTSWSNAQAGDLAFYGDLSHVGIIAGKDADGNILVIHCSIGRNNVVITTNSGFGFAARPRCY